MGIAKLKTKQFIGASLNNVKEYFTKINEIIDNLNNSTIGNSNQQYCVLRNTSGVWNILNDSNHSPSPNIISVTSSVNGNFKLNYQPISKVGSMVANVDETYAKYGLYIGSSVGLSSSDFYIYKQGISGYISYNGSNWSIILNNSLLNSSDFSFSFDNITGKLTVNHTIAALENEAFSTNLTPRLGTTAYNMYLGSLGSTSFEVYFKDYLGNTVLTPTNQMRFYFDRNGMWQVPNSLLGISGSNIWITGVYNT